jgi:hypothetical protein
MMSSPVRGLLPRESVRAASKGSERHSQTAAVDQFAALAYKFWLARCFRDGSPEEDLFRAVCANSMKSGVRSCPRRAVMPQAVLRLRMPAFSD